jgi:putative spermidine/putrescine transport system substrate-binding protein
VTAGARATRTPRAAPTVLVIGALLLAAACTAERDEPRRVPEPDVFDEIGEPEGALDLVAFAGYVEDGSSDPEFDWVVPFQRATGCAVTVRYVDSGEEIVRLLGREEPAYDGASVPGDAAGRLIATRDVAAVEPELFPLWDQILPPLREENDSHYIVDGHVFGVPALYGPNLLMYDTERVRPAPESWDVVFDEDTPYAGRIAMLDSPMAIADAALYLATHEPELEIEDPYALTSDQLDAATALLDEQEDRVGVYWSLLADSVDAFRDGDVVVGTAWPFALSLLEIEGYPVDAADPAEGMTGWADTWMIAADAPHPNCMLLWMRWTMSAEVQADMALWYGGAPSNGRACSRIREELGQFSDVVDSLRFGRCGDEAFLASLALWRMPTVACGDERGRTCTGLPAWLLHWRSVRD